MEDEVEVTTEETGSQMKIEEMITMKGAGSIVDEEVDPRHRDVAMTKIIIGIVGGVHDGMMLLRQSSAV